MRAFPRGAWERELQRLIILLHALFRNAAIILAKQIVVTRHEALLGIDVHLQAHFIGQPAPRDAIEVGRNVSYRLAVDALGGAQAASFFAVLAGVARLTLRSGGA